MLVFKAAVVGAGTMGGQIAQTIASSGIPVVLKDVRQELVDAGLAEARTVTEKAAGRLVRKGKATEEQAAEQVEAIVGRMTGTTSYEGFGDVDLVVEAVPERMDVKQAVFAELDACTPGHAVLASNTSGLSITEIAAATVRPQQVVGFHYFFPAAVMPLVEIVEGEDTSPETTQTAFAFAQAIGKQAIVCGEVPGFVVNRILNVAIAEIWRAQEEGGLDVLALDAGLEEAKVLPMGPFRLLDSLGLDTAIHVARDLHDAYDGGRAGAEARFYVHGGIAELVEQGKMGAKSGEGLFTADGASNLPGDATPDVPAIVDLVELACVREACLLIEEGVTGSRDIDVGLMTGAGMDPRRGITPPLMRADDAGLDTVLERFEAAREAHGDRFVAPTLLRRLVAQGRLGKKTGQGFYPYPRLDDRQPAEVVGLETRGDVAIAWLQNGAMNAVSPQVVEDLGKVWDAIGAGEGAVRALVIASANPLLFSAGADIKAFTSMDGDSAALLDRTHALLRTIETSGIPVIAAVNGLAYGGGCELAMAADVRVAARAAVFGQPEIKLGIIPGFGGTQRLPRLVGTNKALEMNLIGDPVLAEEAFEFGLVNRVVDDHELLDTALHWARRLAGQAPLAVAQVKAVSGKADLDEGIAAEKAGFAAVFGSEDGREGIAAFLAKRPASWKGR